MKRIPLLGVKVVDYTTIKNPKSTLKGPICIHSKKGPTNEITINDIFPNGKSKLYKYKKTKIEKEICSVINRYSAENQSNTPDFILAKFLMGCLNTFNKATNLRSEWYKKEVSVWNKHGIQAID